MAIGIDDHIRSLPPHVRGVLRRIRATIKKAAPGATEGISYRIPAFKLNGRPLICFAAP